MDQAMFNDRREAGRKLALELARMNLRDPVVLALPRGGVPVAAEIAEALAAPLDLVIVRKVGAPGNPELAVAAIVDGDPPDVVLNREIVEAYRLDEASLAALVARERPELARRRAAYLGSRRPLPIAGKTAVLVDDGAATGTTMKVAVRALKRRSPAALVVALPVAPPDTVEALRSEADRLVCLSSPARFRALGYFYRNFEQLSDEDVLAAMDKARHPRDTGGRKGGNPRRAADG